MNDAQQLNHLVEFTAGLVEHHAKTPASKHLVGAAQADLSGSALRDKLRQVYDAVVNSLKSAGITVPWPLLWSVLQTVVTLYLQGKSVADIVAAVLALLGIGHAPTGGTAELTKPVH